MTTWVETTAEASQYVDSDYVVADYVIFDWEVPAVPAVNTWTPDASGGGVWT